MTPKRRHALAEVPRLRILRSLGDYLWHFDQQIDELLAEYRPRVHALQNKRAQHDALAEYDLMSTTYHRHMRYSFVMLVVAMTEDALRALCLRATPTNTQHPTLASGARLTAMKDYLTKQAQLVRSTEPEWKPVGNLVKVRDAITHCNGHVNLSRDKMFLRSFARQEPEFKIDDSGMIHMTRGFCYRSLVWADELIRMVQQHLDLEIYQVDE